MPIAKIANPALDLLEEFLHILQEEFERPRTLVKPFADWEVLTEYIGHYIMNFHEARLQSQFRSLSLSTTPSRLKKVCQYSGY